MKFHRRAGSRAQRRRSSTSSAPSSVHTNIALPAQSTASLSGRCEEPRDVPPRNREAPAHDPSLPAVPTVVASAPGTEYRWSLRRGASCQRAHPRPKHPLPASGPWQSRVFCGTASRDLSGESGLFHSVSSLCGRVLVFHAQLVTANGYGSPGASVPGTGAGFWPVF